jgi:hypothetical protein
LKSVYEIASVDIMSDTSNSNVQKAEELKLKANEAFKGTLSVILLVVCLEL